jgi:type IV pilus assembly protein PilQ
MIRKILRNQFIIVIALTSACLYLSSCATNSEPSSSDDDVSSAAEADSGGQDPNAPAGGGDDLSNLDDSKSASAAPGGKDEQNLENELDGADASNLDLDQAAGQQPDLESDLAQGPITEPPAAETPPAAAAIVPPAPAKVRITNIRYLANQAGGTVVIEASGPLTYHAHSEGGNYIIEIDNAQLAAKLSHAYPMRDYSGAFANMVAQQATPDQARVSVQMKSTSSGEPIVQLEGNSLLVVPASAAMSPMVTENNPQQAPVGNGGGTVDQTVADSPLAAHTLSEFLTGNQRFYGKPVSLQTKDADVRDVINFLAEESGSNIVMSDDVKGKVSIKMRKIPWDQALVSVMRTRKLGYVRQGNVIRISSMQELEQESDQAVKIIELQKNLAPVKVKIIPINYGNPDELAKQVTAFLSKEGRAISDNRTNTILITDRESVLDKVERIVKSLDVQPNQVLIEGKIVEAQEQFSSFLGINWGMSGVPTTISTGGGYGGQPITLTPSMSSTVNDSTNAARIFGASLSVGQLDYFGNLTAALAMEERDGMIKVISSPRISVMNKEKAEITQASEQVTITTTVNPVSNDRTQTEKRTPMTLSLVVTPQITSDNSVIMDIEMKRQFPGAEVDPTTHAAPVNTRAAKTKILVRNGSTSVIGGIYQDDERNSEIGVPLLKDIPVLGWLFKAKSKSKDKNELLIFLTPRILQQQAVAQDLTNGSAG